jgi:hyaluronoglucosaminidase
MFPALLETKEKTLFRRNGGIPQKGNLDDHFEVFKKHINDLIPDAAFNGRCLSINHFMKL